MLVGSADEPERTLEPMDGVRCLSVWQGRLISGHGSGMLRVWNVATGACEQVLEGHSPQPARALAVSGSRLLSGSSDTSIKVWAMGEAAPWTCERTLLGHTDWVRTLATWRGKVLSGSDDRSIRAWDVETGEHAATLVGHESYVLALAMHGDRLFSASRDGTIRVWGLGTWEALRTVKVCGRGSLPHPWCLAVSGSHLISGSRTHGSLRQGGILVWSLETLELLHTLPQPTNSDVNALAAMHGAVLAGVGADVVVWGRWTA
jgi:WD40 repeat protein